MIAPRMSTPLPAHAAAISPGDIERPARERARPTVAHLFREALWLGALGFGGGFSVLASIRTLTVERRRWLTPREFANTATVAQMLPGGAAANALAYVGLRFRGPAGALAGYAGFVLPGLVATLALAYAYVRVGAAPRAEAVLGGLSAAVVGIVGRSLSSSCARASRARGRWASPRARSSSASPGVRARARSPLLGIGSGFVVDLGTKRARLARSERHRGPDVALPEAGEPLPRPRPRPRREDTLRAHGALLVLSAAVVHVLGLDAQLLRHARLLPHGPRRLWRRARGRPAPQGGRRGTGLAHRPAVRGRGGHREAHAGTGAAHGTFIGYLVGGLPAALLATIGVLAAPLLLVVALGGFLDRVRSRRPVRAALRGLTPAVAGLMAAATLALGSTLGGGADLAIAAAVGLTLQRFSVNPAIMLALAGAARVALQAAGI